MEKILFRSGGGLGKQIMATAVVKSIRETYPDAVIHVQTSYPEAFAGLDFVDKYFPYGPVPYFYESHEDFHVLECEPYLDMGYRKGEKHLIDAWCDNLDLPRPESKCGIVCLDAEEEEIGTRFLAEAKKPVVAVQFFGGTSYFSPQEAQNPLRPMHYRAIKKDAAQQVVKELSELGFLPIQIGLPTETKLEGCAQLTQGDVMNPRYVMAILSKCQHAILIDSFAQHVWAALGKKDALVLWGGTHPGVLGYDTNKNISLKSSCSKLHCGRPNTFMFDFRGNNSPWKCVLNGRCMAFDSKKIVEEFKLIAMPEKKEPSMPMVAGNLAEVEDAEIIKP